MSERQEFEHCNFGFDLAFDIWILVLFLSQECPFSNDLKVVEFSSK